MKLSELLQIFEIIEKIANQDLPFTTTMRMAKFYRVCYEHYDYYNQEKERLVKEYGESVDNIEKFNEQVGNLLNKEVTVPKIETQDAVHLKISVSDLIKICHLIN